MPFVMSDTDDLTALTLYLDRAGNAPECVLVDAAHAVVAALLAFGWTEERLEQVSISLIAGPEPHDGRWSCTLCFGAVLPDEQYDQVRDAAFAALQQRGYVVGD